jgi:hypothetical protein
MPKRRPHYAPHPLPDVHHRMTPRAERIISLFNERHGYRVLRSTHVIEFLKYHFSEDVSEQRIIRCLRWLMDTKALIRLRNDPFSNAVTMGSLPKLYSANSRRNRALNERHDRASRVIPHEIEIANSVVYGVVRVCRESQGRIRFVDAPDILRNMGTSQIQSMTKPYTWPVEVTYRGATIRSSLTPDRLFGVIFPETATANWLVLEEDLSTEVHQRNDYSFDSGTSIFRKFLTYVFAYHARIPEQLYNIKGFRILFVTDSRARIERAQSVWKHANEALKEFQRQSRLPVRPVPNNVLLCIDRPTLRAGDIFSVPWTNGRGDQVTIDVPRAAAP